MTKNSGTKIAHLAFETFEALWMPYFGCPSPLGPHSHITATKLFSASLAPPHRVVLQGRKITKSPGIVKNAISLVFPNDFSFAHQATFQWLSRIGLTRSN